MPATIYTVGGAFDTTDPDVAERHSENGFAVTARTVGE